MKNNLKMYFILQFSNFIDIYFKKKTLLYCTFFDKNNKNVKSPVMMGRFIWPPPIYDEKNTDIKKIFCSIFFGVLTKKFLQCFLRCFDVRVFLKNVALYGGQINLPWYIKFNFTFSIKLAKFDSIENIL